MNKSKEAHVLELLEKQDQNNTDTSTFTVHITVRITCIRTAVGQNTTYLINYDICNTTVYVPVRQPYLQQLNQQD